MLIDFFDRYVAGGRRGHGGADIPQVGVGPAFVPCFQSAGKFAAGSFGRFGPTAAAAPAAADA